MIKLNPLAPQREFRGIVSGRLFEGLEGIEVIKEYREDILRSGVSPTVREDYKRVLDFFNGNLLGDELETPVLARLPRENYGVLLDIVKGSERFQGLEECLKRTAETGRSIDHVTPTAAVYNPFVILASDVGYIEYEITELRGIIGLSFSPSSPDPIALLRLSSRFASADEVGKRLKAAHTLFRGRENIRFEETNFSETQFALLDELAAPLAYPPQNLTEAELKTRVGEFLSVAREASRKSEYAGLIPDNVFSNIPATPAQLETYFSGAKVPAGRATEILVDRILLSLGSVVKVSGEDGNYSLGVYHPVGRMNVGDMHLGYIVSYADHGVDNAPGGWYDSIPEMAFIKAPSLQVDDQAPSEAALLQAVFRMNQFHRGDRIETAQHELQHVFDDMLGISVGRPDSEYCAILAGFAFTRAEKNEDVPAYRNEPHKSASERIRRDLSQRLAVSQGRTPKELALELLNESYLRDVGLSYTQLGSLHPMLFR